MIHEMFPEMYASDDPTSNWKKELVDKASRVIAISESTKRDLVRIFGTPEDKISVVHLASSLTPKADGVSTLALPDRYILFVGERIRYKNFTLFIKSIAPLLIKNSDLFVVCAGGGGFTNTESHLFTELSISSQVVLYTLDDMALTWLYRKATMFVFPSLYEGFGMPVLEAFSCDCPVIVSDTSSFPEVAQEAAMYVDPLNGESIRQAVEEVLNDREVRERLARLGKKQLEQFSWEKTAVQSMAVYRSVTG